VITMSGGISEDDANVCRAQNLVDEVWRRKADTFMWCAAEGRPIQSFPDLSQEHAARQADLARASLAELDSIDTDSLPHQTVLTLKLVRFHLETESQALSRYWLAQDYGMFPALFPVGPYGGGYLFTIIAKVFNDFAFAKRSDTDRYLALVEDYAHLLEQMHVKLVNQDARGIRIPQSALAGVRTLIRSQANAAPECLRVDPKRLSALGACCSLADEIARRTQERIGAAFAALLDFLDEDYAARAPAGVGMAQFPGGSQVYEALVAEHLSMPVTIEAVHRAGHERMARLEAEMAEIRTRLSYANRGEFHRYLVTDPRWAANTGAQTQARFDAAIRRFEPRLDELFRFKPKARYRAAPLDAKLEGGMTYGFYQEPIVGHPDGVYYFNGSDVGDKTLATAPSLIYHELIPGHHFHIASQKENALLHPLRRLMLFNAFNEGWAEYAATLVGEVGMYENPCERYGRLVFDAFLTCRLVVDTGMNALGWPLERARQYMREHTLLTEGEIRSETIRYSTDIPAQSLAYKMGELKMHELRDRARRVRGTSFDIREFHDIVLGSGALPLQVLDWHVSQWLDNRISP